MVVLVTDEQRIAADHAHTLCVPELSITTAGRTELAHKLAVEIEQLDTIVVGIGHDQQWLFVVGVVGHGYKARKQELTIAFALRAERTYKLPLQRQHLYAMVATVDNVQQVVVYSH